MPWNAQLGLSPMWDEMTHDIALSHLVQHCPARMISFKNTEPSNCIVTFTQT